MPYLNVILGSILSIATWGLIFWIISMFLKEKKLPANINENFTNIDKGHFLFNGEFKLEIMLGLFNMILFKLYFSEIDGFISELLSGSLNDYREVKIPFIDNMHFAAQFFIVILCIDFVSFSAHYFMHKVLWPYHSVHHAAKKITWITSLRLHPLGKTIISINFVLCFYFLGFPAEVLAAALIFDGFYNIFVHANISLEYPKPIRYIFGSPNFHKWHHALDDKRAYDKNFGTMFSIFDVIFKTYYHPAGKLPNEYGMKAPKEVGNTEGFIACLFYPFKWHMLNIKKWVLKLILK